jgi:hypothetical protein
VTWRNLPTVIEFDPQAFARRTCTCGTPPEECVSDATVLVRYYSDNRAETAFKPRIEVETALSVLMAEGWTLQQIVEYVRRGAPPTPAILAKARCLKTTAGQLRAGGFAVVHTPGSIENGPHVSVVWPGDKPFEFQDPDWPPEVSTAFEACFNEVEET